MEAPRGSLLVRLLAQREQSPDAVFATFVEDLRELPVTCSALFERACRFARAYEAAGVAPRELVFVLAPLGPDLLAAFIGGMLARAIPSLLSYPSSKVAPSVYARNLRGVLELTAAR